MNAEGRATVNAMLTYGGGFAKKVAAAAIETDSGIYFARAMVDAYGAADDDNQAIIREHFGDIWDFAGRPDTDRLQALKDAFPGLFAKYAELARQAAEARALAGAQ